MKETIEISGDCRMGCSCVLCGNFIPVWNINHMPMPICVDCIDTLREIVMERKEQEHEHE